jgi:hypothetical protein
MSQGKAWEKDEVITILEPFFKLGCSVAKACDYAGIPRTTVQTWIEDDEELRLKVTAWQNEISVQARRNWSDSIITKGNVTDSLTWLTRKEKEEFAERNELSGPNGDPLFDNDSQDKAKKAVGEFVGRDVRKGRS